MAKITIVDAASKIVELLTPLPSEERARAVQAAMMLLGESKTTVATPASSADTITHEGDNTSISSRARTWMKQSSISVEELQQAFNFTEEGVEVVTVPGKDRKEQTLNSYVLAGVANLVASGTTHFKDEQGRTLAKSSGCYDANNHSSYIGDKGNLFTGTKVNGWTLTTPGLKRGVEIIKELNKQG